MEWGTEVQGVLEKASVQRAVQSLTLHMCVLSFSDIGWNKRLVNIASISFGREIAGPLQKGELSEKEMSKCHRLRMNAEIQVLHNGNSSWKYRTKDYQS